MMNFQTMFKKIKLFGCLLILLSAGATSMLSSASDAFQRQLLIFDGTPNPNWAAWDCCGGTTPGLVADADRGDVYQFEVGAAPTVLGFSSRVEHLSDEGTPTPFDASAMVESGSLSFDMNVVAPTAYTDSFWLMKIESAGASTFAELNLNTTVEGVDPVVGQWQTYTYPLSDLQAAGLDLSAIDVVLIFPAWGTGEGAVYRIDNLAISGTLHDSSNDAPDSNYQDEEPSQYMSLIRDEALALIDENNHVEIPDNVNNIFPYAFVNSTIETVSLPSNLNYISEGAFFGTQLTSIEIPNSVTNIAGFAFAYIPTLNTIEIPNYVTDIGFHAFYNTPLDSVIIGKSVNNIGERAFSGVTGNVYIKRPADTVISIDDFPSDVSIFSCDEVEETGELENCSAAFEGQLRTVLDQAEVVNLLDENGHLSIPENYSSIDYEAFRGVDIQSVVIPEFMTYISDNAFMNTPLQTVILHEAIERIGCGTFANTDLSTVIVPTLSVELCGSNSFENVNADFYFINSYIDEHADDHEEEDEHEADYEHESHGEEFTWGINYFSSGATVYICYALLEGVPVDCQQQFIGEAKSVLDQYAALNLIDENGHAEIPDFYTSIGNSAFSESQLSSIAIPDSIEFIGWSAFADSQLESVIIPNSVTDLGGYAFMNTPLMSAELGDNICVINEFTFSNTLLEHIKIPECVTFIGNESFYDSTLNQVEFGSNLREISWSAFSDTELTSVTFPDSLEVIGESAFLNTALDSVVIPKSVHTIWINAFNTLSEVWFEPPFENSYRTYAFNSDAQILICELDNDSDNLLDCVDSDDDNDGMPDSYEIANGFDPLNADDAHIDDNGKTLLQEYLSAANPDANYPWDNIQGTWRIANEENAISFSQDMVIPLFSIGQAELPIIDCLLDDRIVFKDDGSYIHLFEEATWVPWLGSMDFFDSNSACLGQNNHAVEGVSHVVGTWRIGNSLMDSSTSLTTSSLSIEKPDTYYNFLTINDNRMQLDIFNGVMWRLQLDRVADQDFDAVDDNHDNCPMITNMGQLDTDNDSQGDSCDQDDDNDGIDDALEIANGFDPLIANMDIDQDGITNSQDIDHDNDGALNEFDAFPLDTSEQLDSDNDGVGDNTDVDKDNDGVMNAMDLFPLDAFESADLDGDGIGDNADLFPNATEYSQDTDQDLIPDAWENKYGLDPLNPNDANLDQDNDGYTALEEFEAGTIPLKVLDIDGDGSFDALTDGLIVLRFAFGLRGDALVNGVISNGALRTDSAEIEAYLDSLVPSF
jgi:hypothetical protein